MKFKFNYKEWLKDKEQKLVREDGQEVFPYDFANNKDVKHCVIVNGTVYNMEDENVPIYFERYDPSDDSVRNTAVSDEAKDFQKYTNGRGKQLVIDCANWFIGMAGIFGHYAFFSQKLWKKVKGFKDADEAEVIAAFLHWWFRYKYGFQNMPCGCSWSSSHPSSYEKDDKCFNNYIEKWKPLFKAYSDWCVSQR